MKVLVTGADGFLGKAICLELEKKNFQVLRLYRKLNPAESESIQKDVFIADISKLETLSDLAGLEEIEAIVHCAGLAHQFGKTSKEKFWKVNVEGTKNIANLALKLNIEHFIQISSVSVYGDNNANSGGIGESTSCRPTGFYAESKFEAEKLCKEVFEQSAINLTILRPSTIVGEFDRGNVFRLIKLIDSGRFLWVGQGKNKKSLIYKDDVARAVSLLLKKKKRKTEVFNITSEAVRMKEIVDKIANGLNKKVLRFRLPAKAIIKFLQTCNRLARFEKISNLNKSIKKWIGDDHYSNFKIRDDYGYSPNLTALEAIEREVSWYNKQK